MFIMTCFIVVYLKEILVSAPERWRHIQDVLGYTGVFIWDSIVVNSASHSDNIPLPQYKGYK